VKGQGKGMGEERKGRGNAVSSSNWIQQWRRERKGEG